jgi:hypothetical protein
MPRNYYLGWTIGELEQVQDAIQRALTTGQQTEISIAGVRTVYEPGQVSNLTTQLDRVEYAMYVLDQAESEPSGNYPNPYATRNRHTRPNFV